MPYFMYNYTCLRSLLYNSGPSSNISSGYTLLFQYRLDQLEEIEAILYYVKLWRQVDSLDCFL